MTHCWNNRFDGLTNGAWRAGRVLAAAVAVLGVAARADAVCVGDCNNDGRVSIAETQACVNRSSSLPAPACAAADQNNDGAVDANEVDLCIQAFLDAATCPMVFTPVPTATRTNTVGPSATPAPPTNTVPPTQTFTPTPTPTIAEQLCTLSSASCTGFPLPPGCASKIAIHIAALPVPLNFALSGSIKIGANPAGPDGVSSASCSVGELSPINIPSIGFVCIGPAAGCPPGTRSCGEGAGPALGVDVQADGDAGACSSNAACTVIANTTCGGAAGVLSSACTGHCSGSTPEVCTNDTDCLGNDSCTAAATPLACCTGAGTGSCGVANGACNGPDGLSAAQRNVCQTTCINTMAHGASDPGDIQCNLGSSLVVETGAPCGNGDVLIAVGTTCIPVTTQRASSLISNANFNPGSQVPAAPNVNDLSGATVSCAALDGGSVSGIVGVGAVNFFGSALGDLAVGLQATCQ